MTVKELIAQLQTYPPDAVVLYTHHSDYDVLNSDDLRCYRHDKPHTFVSGGKTHQHYMVARGMICRRGHFMLCDETWQEKGNEEPYIDAVTFPGN